MPEFRRRDSETVWSGDYLRVDRVSFDGGEESFTREIVRHAGSVAIVPFTGSEVVLIRQYRPAVERWLYEIPAGKMDVEGEDPAQTAIRECVEETGLRPGKVQQLHEFYNSPGFLDEHTFLFWGSELEQVERAPQGAEERHAEIVKMTMQDVEESLEAGEIVDAKTIIGLYAFRRRMQ